MREHKQNGSVYLGQDGKAWHIRFYLYSQSGKRTQRSHKLCDKTASTPSKDSPAVQQLAAEFMRGVNEAVASEQNGNGHHCPVCGNRCSRTIQGKFANKQTLVGMPEVVND